MRKGIVITTSEHTRDWLLECLESLRNVEYPIVIVSNGNFHPHETIRMFLLKEGKLADDLELVINEHNGYELGGIRQGLEHFDEFVHLMDSTVIKDISLFDNLFEIPGNVFLTEGGYHYMGKFNSASIGVVPMIETKEQAIALELRWLDGPKTYFTPDLPVHTDVFEEKHGRRNMVLENDYMIKYKATWSL